MANKKDKSGAFTDFLSLTEDISKDSSYTAKTLLVQNFLKKFQGDLYLLCKFLLCKDDKRVYNIKDKSLVKLLSRAWNCPQAEMITDLELGDASETARKFYKKYGKPPSTSTLTLGQLDTWLSKLTTVTKEDDQLNVWNEILGSCTADDLRMVYRIIDHDLRINIGPKFVLGAMHQDAFDAYKNSNDLKLVIDRVISHKLKSKDDDEKGGLKRAGSFSTGVSIMTPIKPMLARPCKSVEELAERCPNGAYAEIKYDGERIQIHKDGKTFKCFSRRLKAVMPHKLAAVEEFIPQSTSAQSVILDAEVLLMDTKNRRPLPFGTLGVHKKANFQDATVCLFVFDILYLNGKPLLDMPIKERRKLLEKNVNIIPNRVELSELTIAHPKNKSALKKKESDKEISADGADEPLKKLMAKCLSEGLEGLVVKDANSLYEPDARHWLKIKKDYLSGLADSTDLICLGGYFGSGNYGGMVSVFLMGVYDKDRDMFLTVCKVGNGFDEKTIIGFQDTLKKKMVKIERDYERVPSWLRIHRSLVPDFVAKDPKHMPVFEVVGAEFTDSPTHTADGISIRFPRVIQIRKDKSWKEATGLAYLKDLVKSSVRSGKDYNEGEDEEINNNNNKGKGKGKGKAKVSNNNNDDEEEEDDDNDKEDEDEVLKPVLGNGGDDDEDDDNVVPKAPKQKAATNKDKAQDKDTKTNENGIIEIQGDVTEPHGDPGNKVVVICSDDTGRWGTKGIFAAIRNRWPKYVDHFEQVKPSLGTCDFFKVDKDDYLGTQYVATIIGQKVSDYISVSEFHPKSFDAAVAKLSAFASNKKCSVHLARLSPLIPKLDWDKVEKSLAKHLVSIGIPTYVYSLQPVAQQPPKKQKEPKKKKGATTTTTTTTTTTSNAISKSDSEDEVVQQPAKKPKKDSEVSGKPVELPSVFQGVTAYIHSTAENYSQLVRYFVAYDGTHESSLSDEITHIVVQTSEIDSEIQEHLSENPAVKVVDPMWAWDSINTRKRRAEESYKCAMDE